MTLKSSLIKGLFLGVVLVAFQQAALAQTNKLPGPRVNAQPGAAGAKAPAAQVIATHGKWQVQCTDIPVGAPAQGGQQGAAAAGSSGKGDKTGATAAKPQTVRQCGMLQSTASSERKNIALTLVMGTSKQNEKTVTMMRILVPIGVYLPLGIALEIDGSPVGRVPFIRCLPQICTAFAETTDETLGKMRKGANANFIIYEAPGVGLTLPISLQGFTAAFNDLKKL
ncbi:MAG: invasion associated locus B family protein [Pseudomonadota bacterium]